MKKRVVTILCTVLVILLVLASVGYYLYEVLWLKLPYTENLLRMLLVVCAMAGALVKLWKGTGRKSLAVYEKAYAKELGNAFAEDRSRRKKLLCACRLYDESNYGKALKYLQALLGEAELRRDRVPVLLFIALCYSDAGAAAEAIKTYEAILKSDPYNEQVHSNLGILYVQTGNFEAALAHYNRAIEIQPQNYYAYSNRANYYFRMGEYAEATADAKQALTCKNNGREAASLLAIIYALQGDEENKKRYYHLALTAGENPQKLNRAIAYYMNEVAV